MLVKKLDNKNFEKETVEYLSKNFPLLFLYADHTDDNLGFVPHLHEELELLYIVRGEAEIFVNGTLYKAKQGDVFVFNSNEIHSCMKTYPSYRTYCLQFDASLLSSRYIDACEYSYIKPLAEKRVVFKNYYENHTILQELFIRCEDEFSKKREGYQMALKGMALLFLTHLFRLNPDLSVSIDEKDPNIERVNFTTNYIMENYAQNIDFRDVVGGMYLNYSYFSRVFKKQTGKSMLAYLNEYRISQALNKLQNSSEPITQIAISCGFNDLNYFSRTFRRLIGIAPSEIQKRAGR